VSAEGKLLGMLMDPDGSNVSHISSITEFRGRLYFGNLVKNYVSFLDQGLLEEALATQASGRE
jgi:hypothetical protein